MVYNVVDYDTYPYLAKQSLVPLMKILEVMKQIFVFSKDDNSTKTESLLEKAYVFLAEGTDFTFEKVFETPHPYPRGEYY